MTNKKTFSSLLAIYESNGLVGLNKLLTDEVDNETFTKEIKDQQENSVGKRKKKIAAAAVQAVEVQKEDINITELYALQHIGTGTIIEKHNNESYLYKRLDKLGDRKEYRIVPISEEIVTPKHNFQQFKTKCSEASKTSPVE